MSSLSMTSRTSSTTTKSSNASSSNNSNKPNSVSYRKARIDDLPGIVDLLERSFDDDEEEESSVKEVQSSSSPSKNSWPSWNPFQKEVKEPRPNLVQLLEQRLQLPQHVLIVANDNKNKIVGFMELGTMPAPIPIEVPVNLPPSATTSKDVLTSVPVRPERPFLANLAVDPEYRRNQIGFKLVQLALKIAAQWESTKAKEAKKGMGGFYFHPNTSSIGEEEEEEEEKKKLSTLYLSVDCDNEGAIAFYQRLDFATVLDESSNNGEGNEDDGGDTPTSVASRSAKKGGARKPKLYLEKELVLSIDNDNDDDKQ